MNSMEEKLWAYIDGSCSEAEHDAISLLVEQDEMYGQKYRELLAFSKELDMMELDEPTMAFTYNVLETIRAVHAQKPLKAHINTGIIKGIAAFFVSTIAGLLLYMLFNINWSAATSAAPVSYKLPDLSGLLNGPVLKGFLFFDLVLVLFLCDTLLYKKRVTGQ